MDTTTIIIIMLSGLMAFLWEINKKLGTIIELLTNWFLKRND